MNKNMSLVKAVCKLLTVSALLGLSLVGCGGGGGGSTDITSGVYIGASVSLSATLVHSGAVIVSTDGSGSTPFSNNRGQTTVSISAHSTFHGMEQLAIPISKKPGPRLRV